MAEFTLVRGGRSFRTHDYSGIWSNCIPLVWKRLLSLPTCFHYCWKCPLGWDKTSHTFISTKSPGSSRKNIAPLALILNINVVLFSIYPYFLFTLLLYFELDVGYLFLKYVLHLEINSLFGHLATLPLRLLQFLPALQYFRLLAFFLCMLPLSALLVLDGIRKLDLWAISVRISRHTARKQAAQSNTDANLYFPAIAVLIPAIIDALLPLGISVNEKTVELKRKWERHLERCHDRGYLRRKSLKTEWYQPFTSDNPMPDFSPWEQLHFQLLLPEGKRWYHEKFGVKVSEGGTYTASAVTNEG
ncbi:hypothetical protein Fcan01_11320 [Folsomia candida]|uniref:Uncharacterized protein n=1 Tax=Folsomia candida TaxID=158441 RepID=A0A226EA67_FOLCA|nr:hypothetical protein Fcan01_11320 [Folsomia candida]